MVAVVMMVVGGGAYAIYVNLFQRGASSPEAVMESLSQAISNKDVTTLYKMVSPEEIDTITESSEAIKNSGSGEFGQKAKGRRADPGSLISNDAISQYLESISVTSSTMTYDVDYKSEDVAIAKISSWPLKVSINQNLVSNLRTRYQDAKGVSLSRDENSFFDNLDLSHANYDGDLAKNFLENIPLEVVMVRESGRWYVSPLMTVAQWSYQDRANSDFKVDSPDYSAVFNEAEGAKSAEGAVEELVVSARERAEALEALERAGARPLQVELVRDGEIVEAHRGPGALRQAAERHRASRTELPYDAWRLSEGEPAVPTRHLELDGRTALYG